MMTDMNVFAKTASVDAARNEYITTARSCDGFTQAAIADNSKGQGIYKDIIATVAFADGTSGVTDICKIVIPANTCYKDLCPSKVIVIGYEILWTNPSGSTGSTGFIYAPNGYYYKYIGVAWGVTNLQGNHSSATPLFSEAVRIA